MAVTNKGGTPVLGLDIGAAFIKAVELHPSRGALVVSGVGVLPTPPGCIVNDEIVDSVTLAAAVKQCLAENNIKTKNVMVSVAGQSSVVIRVIEVPKMTDKELAETMKWEIDRHIPFSPDEVVKDFRTIHRAVEDPNAANMSVLLAVAQNSVVSGMLDTVLKAGLTPIAIDVESLAGARALFDLDDSFAKQTVALVNIGSTKTDVGIYEGGTLAFPRTIPVAGNAMTEAVAARMGIDVADAERLKKQHGCVAADASARFGAGAPVHQEEEQFNFSDFGGGIDFSAPLSASAAAPAAPAAPAEAGGFAATTEGPVFGDFPPMPADAPTFGEPAFGTAPTFGAPEPEPVFGSDSSFTLPDVGPMNFGPAGDIPQEHADTPPVPPVAAAPEPAAAPAPAAAPVTSVPEVLSEQERNRREISDAFMPVLAELVAELKRSVEYYSTRANDARVDRIVLFGGVSNLPGLNAFMETELGLPVQSAGLPKAVSISGKAVAPEYISQVAPMLPVAIGLAARNAVAGPPASPQNGKAKKGK
ncbi:MAG TPA: type IV pilus assembly protein PilM [Armatimonadota bacterium]|jgi:type IV pilus assembly protein PilM